MGQSQPGAAAGASLERGAHKAVASGGGGRLVWAMSKVEEIELAIEQLDARQQVQLLRELPARLKIAPEDLAGLRTAEPAFAFWDNPDDAAYDHL